MKAKHSMNTHTPGPFHVQQSDAGTIDVCKTSDGIRSRICRLHVELLADEHGGSVIGNANLIASAPTLLAQRDALREALTELLVMATELLPLAPNGCGWGTIALDNARAAITNSTTYEREK